MNTTRRRFLKIAAGAGAAALAPMAAIAKEAPGFGPNEVGMLYDSTLCVGCKACVSSCRKVNFYDNLDPIVSDADREEGRWVDDFELNYRTRNIIKMHRDPVTNEPAFIKRQCNHCHSAGCVSACPVKAMTKDPETGIVTYDMKKCVGCRYCMIACPFNIPTFEWHRALPRIVKCELCKDTNLKEKGIPACCEVCPTKAVIYGKRSDLLADARSRLSAEPNKYINKVYGEHDYGGTNVIYLAKVDFELLGMPNLPDYSYASKSENLQHTIYKTLFHVPVAPVVLFAALAVVATRHQKKRNQDGEDK